MRSEWKTSKLIPKVQEISELSPKLRVFFLWLFTAAITFVAVPAHATDELEMRPELSPFSLRLGVYDMNLSTEVRVDGRGGNVGSELDFEDDLNLDRKKDTFDIAFRWRFRERHYVEAEHFRLKRNGFRRLDGELRFGDNVFPVGADLQSGFTTEVTRVGYTYELIRSRDWGLGIGAGLHVTRLRAVLSEIIFDNPKVPVGNAEIAAVTAPLPVFGFSGARRLGEKWALLARGQWLSVQTDDIDGSIEHAAVYVEHDTTDWLGLGLGYDWFTIDVDAEDRLWLGNANVSFHGPMLFLKGSF